MTDHPIHVLWCHPRSVSTAFERVMRQRGDCTAFHEPFMYFHYLERVGRPYAGFEPDPTHPQKYDDIREMLLQAASKGPVFQKDMAYYVVPQILQDDGLLGRMRHAILVRDPAQSIASYAKVTTDFTSLEVGLRAQWELYEGLVARGHAVHVICADALRADAAAVMSSYWEFAGLEPKPEALSWDQSMPKGWETVSRWHQDVLASGGIRGATATDTDAALARLGAPFTEYYQEHKPYYDRLKALAG